MSFVRLESLIDHRSKDGQNRNRKSFTLAACLLGTAVVCTLLVVGASHHPALSAAAPQVTSLQVRGEFPVSTFIYERGFFHWFIGVGVIALAGYGATFGGLGTACVIGGPITVAGCVLGAVGAIATVAAIAQSYARRNMMAEFKLMRAERIYLEPVDKSSKREISPVEQFMSELFGVDDYHYEGHIAEGEEFNKRLVEKNNGAPVPVFSFTTPKGLRLHHALAYDETDGSLFHRFGIIPPQSSANRRTDVIASYADEYYFKSGGIDALSTSLYNGNDQYLSTADYSKMDTLLECAVPNFSEVEELAVQIYDATTQETIGDATIAPVQADGDTVLFNGHKFPPPLTQGNSCAQQTASD